jgi:type IV fimbrial biogenesis protein FimT
MESSRALGFEERVSISDTVFIEHKNLNRDRSTSDRHLKFTGGLTMIELLVTVAILAILGSLAAPSFTTLIDKYRILSASTNLTSDLNLARVEAIKRNSRVLVCISNSTNSGCAAGNNWGAGWLICVDADYDNTCDVVASTSPNYPNPFVIRSAVSSGLTLTATAGATNIVRFNPNGTAVASTLSLTGTSHSRTIAITLTGNIIVR